MVKPTTREPATNAGRVFALGSVKEAVQLWGTGYTTLTAVLAIEAEAASSDALDEAWRRCEAACPSTAILQVQRGVEVLTGTKADCRAFATPAMSSLPIAIGMGPTPADALNDLALALEGVAR